MKTIRKTTRHYSLFWLISYLVFFLSNAFASPDFNRYRIKGNEKLAILNSLNEKYPFAREFKDQLESTNNQWTENINRYRSSVYSERREAFNAVKKNYSKILEISRHMAIIMRGYAYELMEDFFKKEKSNPKDKPLDKEKYAHHLSIAKQDMRRAESALKRRQWAHGAGVFDHSIKLILKSYKNLEWEKPAYLKMNDKKENNTPKKTQ